RLCLMPTIWAGSTFSRPSRFTARRGYRPSWARGAACGDRTIARDASRRGQYRLGVSYRDEITGRVHSVRLAMPQDADIRIRRVSVLTPVGTALIGRAEGAVIDCEFPAGTLRRLAILRISKNGPKPESAGIFRRESVRRMGDATSEANRPPHVASERRDLERMSFI
ncbi:hypothetical protein CNY89_21565, partial [Amaricoccus sp. HAR-UPW-R2A-40]